MNDSVHYFNLVLGISAIFLQIISVLTLVLLLLKSKENKFLSLVKEHFLLVGLIFSFSATAFSLFYSQIFGYAPCYLCWWQRIFIFPQLILFGVAFFKKDKNIGIYALPLLLIGFLIAIYHNFIYYFGEGIAPCDASGVSCVQQLVSEFNGYISIPMLSLTSFIALITLLLVVRFYKYE